jgi:PAS domain S-box-containing protein
MPQREYTVMDLERIQLIYFVINRALEITDSGKLMIQRVPLGANLRDALDVLRPKFRRELEFDDISSFRDRIFVLRAKSGDTEMFFRGEFMPGDRPETLTFYGISWSPTEADLRDIHDGSMVPVNAAAKGPDTESGASNDLIRMRFDSFSQMDASLLREKQRFEALFDYSTMAILVSDDTGSIVLANRMARQTFGYEPEEFIGRKVEDFMPERFRVRHVGKRDRFHERPQNRTMGPGLDLYAQRKDGTEFPVEISLGHYETEEGKFVIAYVIDITRRKEIEQAILRQQEEMARAHAEIESLNEELEAKVEQRTRQLQETMEILEKSRDDLEQALSKEKELSDLKTRFVSMASHEFRTPLSTILSSASLVAKYILSEEQDKRDKHIQRIRSAVSNLTDILNEFLSIGRLEEGKIQVNVSEFNLRDQAQLVCNEMQTILKPGQRIKYAHQGPMTVKLDLSMLRNIFINLISNALKFSPENGLIEVQTDVNEKQILISVRDHGIGISEEDQKHLFERFFRGKNATNIQGTGLGLHIVSKYAELMGGSICVESELDEGTRFIVKFRI